MVEFYETDHGKAHIGLYIHISYYMDNIPHEVAKTNLVTLYFGEHEKCILYDTSALV